MEDNKNQQSTEENKNLGNEPNEHQGNLPADLSNKQEVDELEKKHALGSRQGNSSIPLDNEDTIGIP